MRTHGINRHTRPDEIVNRLRDRVVIVDSKPDRRSPRRTRLDVPRNTMPFEDRQDYRLACADNQLNDQVSTDELLDRSGRCDLAAMDDRNSIADHLNFGEEV